MALALHGCRDATEFDPNSPLANVSTDKQLVISGDGTGSGTVTVPPTGGRVALNCPITLGVAASTCSKFYPLGTLVTLTATPAAGHSFVRWTGACSGSAGCSITMSVTQTVTATFAPSPSSAVLTVGGGGGGKGSVVADQPPGGINCTLTAGAAGATGCVALYPLGSIIGLTATPVTGYTFAGWTDDCAAAGAATRCVLTLSRTSKATAIFAIPGTPAPEAQLGRWDLPFTTPIVAVHLSLLSTGRVLLWGHLGEPWLWSPASYPSDPASGFTQVAVPTEEFCSGHAFLPDGRLFVVGGHDNVKGNGFGIPDVNAFDGQSWQSLPPMAEGRWYPTATTLPTGEVLVTAGTDNNNVNVTTPEVWSGSAWRKLTSAVYGAPYYPRMFVAPNGKVFFAGQGANANTRYLSTTGAGTWTNVGLRVVADRDFGSAVMVDGQVLYAGGGGKVAGCVTGAPVTASAELIDLRVASPKWRATGSMTYRRRQLNLTILADGKVLATGGTSGCGLSNEGGSVYAAEVWDPATEQWSVLASMRVFRVYHSTAILLPDARVLSAGSGDNPGSTSQFNAEIFTPPYLYAADGTLAPRPSYTPASTTVGYGQALSIASPDASSINKVTLVYLSAVTHAFNETQRLNTLSFTLNPDGTGLTVTTPANSNLAPPGPYMLFLINSSGVPSVGQILTLR